MESREAIEIFSKCFDTILWEFACVINEYNGTNITKENMIEAFTLAIQALRNEARRKELIEQCSGKNTFDTASIAGKFMRDKIIEYLEKCEVEG